MEDRLSELNRKADDNGEEIEEVEGKGKEREAENENSDVMEQVLAEVGLIKAGMGKIKRNIAAIENKAAQSLSSVATDNKMGNEIQGLIDDTNKHVLDVRGMLDNMKKKNLNTKGSTTEERIKTNMHSTLATKFLEVVQEFQEAQTNYKNSYKEKMERQFKIAKPNVKPEEIEQAIESGDSSNIFADQILDKNLTAQAKSALAYIEARHDDIKKIELSIQELHQLFIDMATLVDAQGEMLNQIEFNVSQSVDYVKAGTEQMRQAVVLQRKGRKLMCCGCTVM